MATQITEIWSDLDHQLVVDAKGGIKKVINVDAVKTSINNILLTRFGERVMLPEFGSSINDILFEGINSSSISNLDSVISDAIKRWDNRAILKFVKVKSYPDQNKVDIDVSFIINGYDQVFQTSIAM